MSDQLSMTPERLTEIQALVEAATPGPWRTDGHWVVASYEDSGNVTERDVAVVNLWPWRSRGWGNECFIAAARTAVPELVAEVERLRTALREIRALVPLPTERIVCSSTFDHGRRSGLVEAAEIAAKAMGEE